MYVYNNRKRRRITYKLCGNSMYTSRVFYNQSSCLVLSEFSRFICVCFCELCFCLAWCCCQAQIPTSACFYMCVCVCVGANDHVSKGSMYYTYSYIAVGFVKDWFSAVEIYTVNFLTQIYYYGIRNHLTACVNFWGYHKNKTKSPNHKIYIHTARINSEPHYYTREEIQKKL